MLIDDVKRTGMDYGIFERLNEAWAWWRRWVPAPGRVRIVADDDSDGITSAFIVGTVLKRVGYEVDIKAMPVHSPADVDVAMKEPRDGYVILDMGSAVLEYIDSFRIPTLVIDHHRVHDVNPQNTFEVNPRRIGGDKAAHVSTSVLAGLFAVALAEENWSLAFAGVAGGISDRQHLGGFNGLLGYLAAGAVANGYLASSKGLTLVGETVEDAVTQSLDPFFESYTGNREATRALLKRLDIDFAASPIRLADEKARRLASELESALRAKGVVVDRMYPLYAERYLLRNLPEVPSVFGLAQLMEAATAEEAHEIALGVLRGDRGATRHAQALYRRRQADLLKEASRLRDKKQELPHLRWAETIDEANTGVYAHTLLTFVYGDDKPFLIVAKRGNDAKFSGRGSSRLFLNGVDLSIGMDEAARSVGGHGGGHPGASGATVPYAKRDDFLAKLSDVLGRLRRGPP